MLVGLPGRKGIGKLVSAADGRCTISIFHSIRRREEVEHRIDEIGRAYLSPQTRAYVLRKGRVDVGRVVDYFRNENGLVSYEIRFPNGKQEEISEIDLFVRPWNAPEDPAEILAAGGAESQFLHDRRQSAIGPLRALASASQGLTSLLSAGVDFVPHQVAAVRRVLTDPIQRYLLADEVGLGKTIEAGLIIRQHLIDDPETKVLIATPSKLCGQWRHELNKKLRLDQFGEAFECCSHEDLVSVNRSPDVLVVDEAHHLVGHDGRMAGSAVRLRELAKNAPVLLLLSATPPLGEEANFLALLNLLDPQTHPLEDLAGFRAKLEQRRSIGRLLLSLNPDAPGIVLRQRSIELERSFPDDQIIQDLAPRIIAATHDKPAELAGLCGAMKEHIADSYRIHQRLIRSRRADAQGWEFRPRGPDVIGTVNLSHVRTESDPAEIMETLLATLEDWRFAAVESLAGDDSARTILSERYRALLMALGTDVTAFRDWLGCAEIVFNGEGEILAALRAQAENYGNGERISTMVESSRRLLKTLGEEVRNPKIVVFATSERMAEQFHAAASETLSSVTCFLFAGPEDDNVSERFQSSLGPTIMVAEKSAEEGLNLSFANAIVHLDLPLSAGRIEQRIGRLDRYGRRQGIIRHRILLPSNDDISPWFAWYEFLAQGFSIFNRSISDVQFLLDQFEREAFETLLVEGPEALVRLASDVRTRIDEERKSQDEQYALDRIALAEEPVETFIQTLEDAEADESAIERDVDQWLIGTLQVKKRPFAWPKEDPFKLAVTNHTLIPRLPWQTGLKLDGSQPLTWKRRIAISDSDVTLLRPGTPLIDAIERFTRWDDRGTAFITYRIVNDWQDEPWIGFKLCFTIEPALEIVDLLAPSRAELAAFRRAQRYFSTTAQTVIIDVNGDDVSDPTLLTILERPYREEGRRSDINLGSRPHLLAEIMAPETFQRICRQARDGVRQRLAHQPEIAEKIAAAARLAETDLSRRESRLRRRQSAGDAMARKDMELIETILLSIREPTVRLEAMGCFVVGGPRLGEHFLG